jgi:hypothetical protein
MEELGVGQPQRVFVEIEEMGLAAQRFRSFSSERGQKDRKFGKINQHES